MPSKVRKKGFSQEDAAHLIGVSVTHYASLERGVCSNYSDHFLDRVAAAFRLTDEERIMLYMLSVGHEPAPRVEPSDPEITQTMRRLVQQSPWPTYICDTAWDVLIHNQVWERWFPHSRQDPNVMNLVFLYPELRHQFINWERDWASPMVAQMRLARARHPYNERLATVVSGILAGNEVAARLWNTEVRVQSHPDGERRWLDVPVNGRRVLVEIIVCMFTRAESLRWTQLAPVDSSSDVDRDRLCPARFTGTE